MVLKCLKNMGNHTDMITVGGELMFAWEEMTLH